MPSANLPQVDEANKKIHPHCVGRSIKGQSQAPESMADLFTGRVMARLLKGTSMKPIDQSMTFWLLSQKACSNVQTEELGADFYFSAPDRINKLILSNKDLRDIFGCPPSAEKDCSEYLSPAHRSRSPFSRSDKDARANKTNKDVR